MRPDAAVSPTADLPARFTTDAVAAARTFALVPETGAAATIVAGEGLEASAAALRAGLRQVLGGDFPVVSAPVTMAGQDWRLKDEWLDRPLILLGNIANNRVMFALFSHFLEGANAAYPGPGRYSLRVLFEPFRRGVPLLSLGASDQAGLDAGVHRLMRLVEARRGVLGPLIELGTSAGPLSVSPTCTADFVSAVSAYYWQGDTDAGQRARQLLLEEAARRGKGLWGFHEDAHYSWERYFRPLRQLLSSGLLSVEEQRQVDLRLADIALESTDWAGQGVLRMQPGDGTNLLMTRHPLSALVGHFIIHEYLATVGTVPAERQGAIAAGYARLREHVRLLIEDERFTSNEVGEQGGDNLSFMAAMYLLLGDSRVVERRILARMADYYLAVRDNLGLQAGDDAYIGCRPGCHQAAFGAGGLCLLLSAHFHNDGRHRWLLDNTPHFMSHMQGDDMLVPQPPEIAQLVAGVEPEAPDRYCGLNVLPMDPWWYRRCSSRQADEMMAPLSAPAQKAFNKAVFRDGHDADDAYLLLQGVNLGGPAGGEGFCANSIVRYTELGSLLLFANTYRHSSWARSLVSASRGKLDPQGTACVLGAHFSTVAVSGLQSIQEYEGGLSWCRTIVHRAHGYFVVLDSLTAREPDTYSLTCRWRSLHRGALTGDRHFEATDAMRGVSLHIRGGGPTTWQVTEEPIDGAARPTILRQFQRVTLQPGEAAHFHNLLHASDRDHPRAFEFRSWTPESVLVSGSAEGFREMAAIGTGPLDLNAISSDRGLWYISGDTVVLSGVRRADLRGVAAVEAEDDVTLGLLPGDGGAWVENLTGTDVQVTIRLPGSSAAATPDPHSCRVPPGRQPLDLAPGPLLDELSRELEALWEEAPAAPAAVGRPPLDDAPLTFVPVWTHQGVPPDFRRHREVRATAEPPVQIGHVSTWCDGVLGTPRGFDWHGSERAGWLAGTRGTIVLDLGREVDVREIRLVRSRAEHYDATVFRADDYTFTVEVSNDGFRRDRRRREPTHCGLDILYSENAHYTYTRRFPVLVVPVGERARYVRLSPQRDVPLPDDPVAGHDRAPDGTYSGPLQDAETSFMEIEVVTQDREPGLASRLWPDPSGATGSGVLYQAGSHLQRISAQGELLWDRDLGAPLAAEPVLADVNGDGRTEILSFTLAGIMAAHDLDGKQCFRLDVREATRDEETTGMLSCRPACVAAWRPDSAQCLEYLFFPHYSCYRVSPAPELEVSRVEHPGTNRGGKFAFTVPDVTGDGKEDLAVVGLYGFAFGVIPSETPLEDGILPSYVGLAPLTGHSSGNQEYRLYHYGEVVRDDAGAWLGIVAMNPGGVDFFTGADLKKSWSHFSHPPILCSLVTHLDLDVRPEVVIGREDGYVVAFEVEQGKMVARTALDGAVRSLALLPGDRGQRAHVLAATDGGLTLLNPDLQPLAHRDGAVGAVTAVQRPAAEPLIVAVTTTGEVRGYRLHAVRQ